MFGSSRPTHSPGFVDASATGKTGPLPASRSSAAMIVSVHPESTMSSTRRTDSFETEPWTAKTPSRFLHWWYLLCCSFCGSLSLILTTTGLNGNPRAVARRLAKSGTRLGFLVEGTQVTQVGGGDGCQRARNMSTAASTSSSENSPASLPSATSRPPSRVAPPRKGPSNLCT